MIIHIKNVLSIQCKSSIRAEFENLHLKVSSLELNEWEVHGELSLTLRKQIKMNLLMQGLELVEARKTELVLRIKDCIIDLLGSPGEIKNANFSLLLARKLNHSYTYLANVFSEVTGTTIEQYIILNKVEMAKTLLLSGELNLTEVSYKLQYSSVAHLSSQFKKVTGETPSEFKQRSQKRWLSRQKFQTRTAV